MLNLEKAIELIANVLNRYFIFLQENVIQVTLWFIVYCFLHELFMLLDRPHNKRKIEHQIEKALNHLSRLLEITFFFSSLAINKLQKKKKIGRWQLGKALADAFSFAALISWLVYQKEFLKHAAQLNWVEIGIIVVREIEAILKFLEHYFGITALSFLEALVLYNTYKFVHKSLSSLTDAQVKQGLLRVFQQVKTLPVGKILANLLSTLVVYVIFINLIAS